MTGDASGAQAGREARPVTRLAAADGTLTYLVAHGASDLPSVRVRDILAAWQTARQAARTNAAESRRIVRFRRDDDSWSELWLVDPDARCWAGAVDAVWGLGTSYGLSVCLRLLALVALLAHARWASGLVRLDGPAAEVDPTLLRLAAEARLTDDGGFDEARLRARLGTTSVPCPAKESYAP